MYNFGHKSTSCEFEWVGNWSARRAKLTPNREAIVDNIEKKRYTFQQIDDRANQLAQVLIDNGIKIGDRVAILAKNSIDCIDLYFALSKIGAILVPLNVRLSVLELEFLIQKTKPKLLLYGKDMLEKTTELKKKSLVNIYYATGVDELDGDPSIRQLFQDKEPVPSNRSALNLEDPSIIMFTGGTTGLPKGAILSHRLIFWNSVNTIISWGLNPEDVQPLLFPLFHTGGWNVLLLPFFHLGAKTILMGDFDPLDTLKIIEEEKCTIVITVPTVFLVMANLPQFKNTNFDSVKIFISGGAPCPVAIMEKYWARKKLLKMGYGLTEVGPNNFYLPESEIKRKPTSVGFPVFHCDMRVVDTETNDEIPQGNVGELLLKGPHIFSGYWEEPEETKKTIGPDGWVHTGDLVKIDDEGFYYIVGRKKEMYISGGENIFPVEIEEILYKHPAIDLAAVIGVPDEKWGEVGKVFFTLKPNKQVSIEEVKEYLVKRLAKYKIPKYFEIRDVLPTSAAGKILKKDLK
ncbi:MAG: long-chain fatty acid--CoA ligase [Candidatus Lokiarchaeota archaeon]|nr:long-chain fatty acid--CoA ligase [Candidatus Lokiarchaeota archaeon]